jgi:hypothetical protein
MQPFSLYSWMQGGEPTAALTVRLYSARTTPLPTQPTVGDFTECDYGGYHRIAFPPSSQTQWLPNGIGQISLPSLLWTWGGTDGGESVAGEYHVAVREDGSQVVLGYEDFPSPLPMTQGGDYIAATLVVTAQSLVITV